MTLLPYILAGEMGAVGMVLAVWGFGGLLRDWLRDWRAERKADREFGEATPEQVAKFGQAIKGDVFDVDGVPVVGVSAPIEPPLSLIQLAELAGAAAESRVARRQQDERQHGPGRHRAEAWLTPTQLFEAIAASEGHPVTEHGPREITCRVIEGLPTPAEVAR